MAPAARRICSSCQGVSGWAAMSITRSTRCSTRCMRRGRSVVIQFVGPHGKVGGRGHRYGRQVWASALAFAPAPTLTRGQTRAPVWARVQVWVAVWASALALASAPTLTPAHTQAPVRARAQVQATVWASALALAPVADTDPVQTPAPVWARASEAAGRAGAAALARRRCCGHRRWRKRNGRSRTQPRPRSGPRCRAAHRQPRQGPLTFGQGGTALVGGRVAGRAFERSLRTGWHRSRARPPQDRSWQQRWATALQHLQAPWQ